MNKISQTIPLQVDTVFSPFRADEFDVALAYLSEIGFSGVELAIAYPREVDAERLQKNLDSRGLTATTLSTGQIYGLKGLYLSSFDGEVRAGAVDIIKGHIELSSRIGFPPVTVGLLRGKLEQGDKSALMAGFRESLLICIEYASEYGVTLQLEPINRSETVLLNSVAETMEFIRALGNPSNVGILYDTYHSNIEDGDMGAAVRMAAHKITNIHLADSHRGLPGYGDIDFSIVMGVLRETGYGGAYALETLSIPDQEFVKQKCYDSVIDIF